MPILSHKFSQHQQDLSTELLIIGTFNPDILPGPDFFYGRPKNYLWELLPQCFDEPSLKYSPLTVKHIWIAGRHIDFIDLIAAVDVPEGQEANVEDAFIDDKVTRWADVTGLLDRLPGLRAIYFTRKSFGDVPHIRQQILRVRDHARIRGIYFACLETPARFTNAAKQAFWRSKVIDRTPCQAL
jgi:G:T/U-mismatch repair DNA glycosylase